MKLKKCHVENFGSFRSLDFDYSNQGLTSIAGPTKSGKSTLLDAPCWTVFGMTSKDVAADEVKSWFAESDTVGTQEVETPKGTITVTRIRGASPVKNDLYYTEASAPDVIKRGKDAVDTQKLINARIGVQDPELYLISAYIHQFSKSEGFFIAKAKDRRETMEKIADQSLAIKLGNAASEERKVEKKTVDKLEIDKSREAGKLEELERTAVGYAESAASWLEKRKIRLEEIDSKARNFEKDNSAKVDKIIDQLAELDEIIVPSKSFEDRLAQVKVQLTGMVTVRKDFSKAEKELNEVNYKLNSFKAEKRKLEAPGPATCPVCLGPADNQNKKAHLGELTREIEDNQALLKSRERIFAALEEALAAEPKIRAAHDKVNEDSATNQRLIDKYENLKLQAIGLRGAENAYLTQYAQAEKETNPFIAKLSEQKVFIKESKARLSLLGELLSKANARISSLTWLYDKSFELRAELMRNAVRRLNNETNRYLEQYFESSLRVKFALVDSDKLDVIISNSGYPCSFKQLSGGERCMLKLSFSVSLMQAAQDRAGIKFAAVMLDESLNGLSDDLKVKAFGLLQELENQYSTVLVIDHSEAIKDLFTNRYQVTNVGHSEIRKA